MVGNLRSETKSSRIRIHLLSMCRSELSAVIARLMSKYLYVDGNDGEELKRLPPPSPAVLWIVNVLNKNPDRQKTSKREKSYYHNWEYVGYLPCELKHDHWRGYRMGNSPCHCCCTYNKNCHHSNENWQIYQFLKLTWNRELTRSLFWNSKQDFSSK